MTRYIYALGFFDGVHRGHQALLAQAVSLAQAQGCAAAAITFDRHPKSVFSHTPTVLISSIPDREAWMRHYGMETIKVIPATRENLATPWETFLEELIREGAAGFVCGDDFTFGDGGLGTPDKLADFAKSRNLPCVIVPEQSVDGIRVSSTYIRRQIETGDMATAVKFLGHPYTLTGVVVHGQQLGRTLGIPTANLHLPQGLAVPKFGVYACRVTVDGESYPAVTNIGTRPTVGGTGITVEAWILDYTGNLYGRQITLEFYRFLRGEQKFESLSALQAEIRRNAEQTRSLIQRAFT